jgi:hypothetical protein
MLGSPSNLGIFRSSLRFHRLKKRRGCDQRRQPCHVTGESSSPSNNARGNNAGQANSLLFFQRYMF